MGEKASVLVVDDDGSLRKSMSLVLRRKGYAVATAKGGASAVARIKEQPFDVVFLDIVMPLKNGVETYREIKEIRPEAVVVMMTAYSVEGLIQQAVDEGAYGIVHKPVEMDRVVALIEEARRVEKGMFILVLDDDPGTAAGLRSILTHGGYEVGVAQNGEEAIGLAQEQDVEIMLLDLKLPTINGLETYRRIKELRPQAVAIMMTAHREEVADLVQEALRHSAYTCLYKPFDMDLVLRLVGEIAERKREER